MDGNACTNYWIGRTTFGKSRTEVMDHCKSVCLEYLSYIGDGAPSTRNSRCLAACQTAAKNDQ
jgi:hypothetical protein